MYMLFFAVYAENKIVVWPFIRQLIVVKPPSLCLAYTQYVHISVFHVQVAGEDVYTSLTKAGLGDDEEGYINIGQCYIHQCNKLKKIIKMFVMSRSVCFVMWWLCLFLGHFVIVHLNLTLVANVCNIFL